MTLGAVRAALGAYVLRHSRCCRAVSSTRFTAGWIWLPRAMAQARRNRPTTPKSFESTGLMGPLNSGCVRRGGKKPFAPGRAILAIPFSTLQRIGVRPASESGSVCDCRPSWLPGDAIPVPVPQQFLAASGTQRLSSETQPAEIWTAHSLDATRGILRATVGELGLGSRARRARTP